MGSYLFSIFWKCLEDITSVGFLVFSSIYPPPPLLVFQARLHNLFQEAGCPRDKHLTRFSSLWPHSALNFIGTYVDNDREMRTITDATDLAIYLLFELELHVHLCGCDLEHGLGI